MKLVQQAVQRALTLDPNLAEAYAIDAGAKMLFEWDWAGAEQALQRAVRLAPGSALVVSRAARLHLILGQFEEAIRMNRRAIELDPLSAEAVGGLVLTLFCANRYAESEEAQKKMLELAPDNPLAHNRLGRIYLRQKRFPEALSQMEKIPESIYRPHGLALAYGALGRKEEAEKALRDLIKNYQKDAAVQIAEVYGAWGQFDDAFEWLERPYRQRDSGLVYIRWYTWTQPVAADPRFRALMRKIKLD